MPSTNKASPPQDLVGKSKYRLKNIRKKSQILDNLSICTTVKKSQCHILTRQGNGGKGKMGQQSYKIQHSEGYDYYQYFFCFMSTYVNCYILDLLTALYTEPYFIFILCICSLFVFSVLALNTIFHLIFCVPLPFNKSFLSQ